ncbi:MAG: RagB/SusD family nutrient uptake outer membrane protein [Bacteroidetes bacterium]|nr:RagB/SusD family nutrient uptake outer membrane protein [Bacteroidota bacterium]
MKKLMYKIVAAGMFASVVFSSCKKQLDIPSRNSLDASVALTNKSGIEFSINSIYSILKRESHYGRDLFSVTDAMADITFANGRSSRLLAENRNTALSNVVIWGGSYAAINEINLTLAAIPAIGDATAADKTRWEGELKFLRAFYYFDLVRNYAYIPTFTVPAQDKGGVVITLQGFNSGQAAADYRPSRATTTACYAQIMSDLYTSITLLSNNNRGRNYASKHAALALGSRIALYEGNWARADSFATAAITLTGGIGSLTNTGNYVTGWRAADHPEGIFQVWYATLAENLGVNTSLAATHTTLAAPGAFNGVRQGQGDLVPNAFLLTQLGISGFPANLAQSPPPPALTYSNDVRNRLFEWGVNASGHYVECTKWLGKNGGPNWDNTVVLRWAELYLNRAEARYRLANESGAWSDLNVIRAARYTGFVVPVTPLTGQPLLDEIWRQRMLEFAFEGHRFYDLKRNGLTINKANPVVSMPATDYRLLPRIPVSEVDGNPNMIQNFGY